MEPGSPEEPSIGQAPNSVPAPPQELHANDSAPCSNPTQALGKHPSLSCPLYARCSRPWRALGAQAPHAGEAHRPELPSSPCTTLRTLQPRESTSSGLRMSRAGSRANPRPESATGTPIWLSPTKRHRRTCVPGEPRRRPSRPRVPDHWIPIGQPSATRPRVKLTGYRSARVSFANETLLFLEINPQSNLIQK